ncbi:hypothetical protein M0D69_14015 [Caballeronia sp. SEWSISQ10-4 2]|uniref:hypothetical protein n=1 Tax=Caballeronia sp. SEWSISQ10-4 2 TaxID=2937438 RepID=UPI00264A7DEC|nr:hypothetical protein [Caballeronia sp. SEWSISQ10-4 2]MDN7179110.1 hypothetical protein [Caballeronia sp. SEWSISQ10-4 2]
MTIIKLIGFQGEVPRIVSRLLPEAAAASAVNARLETGSLTPYRKPKFVARQSQFAAGTVKTIYRDLARNWLVWDKQVYVTPGPVAADRLYYMGDGAPKMRVAGVTYPLALPFPATKPTATPSGAGSGDIFTRVYVYTYVSVFDEETEPSAASSAINWQAGQTVTLTNLSLPPNGTRINRMRIYRSQTSLSGTDLYFIAEIAASTTTFVDNVPLNQQNEPIPSLDWNAPPDGLTGLIALSNGMMAAFRGKELWFCEPWRPHAWPESYMLTMAYDIVGLGAFGTTIVVATKGQPYMVNGTSPDAMAEEKIELNLPCINPRGIVDLGYAIAYPSTDGLAVISSAGARVVTDNLMTRNQWLRTAPDRFVACQFFGRYFASYEYVDPDGRALVGSFIIDLTGQEAFMHRVSTKADATWYDLATGTMYLCMGTDIYEWDSIEAPSDILVWKSKQFVVARPTNFGAILIEGSTLVSAEEDAAVSAAIQAAITYNASIYARPSIGGEMNGSAFNDFPIDGDMMMVIPTADRYVSVAIYADGKLVATVDRLNRMARLPGGFLARTWEIEVSTNADIAQVTLAGTGAELAGAQ